MLNFSQKYNKCSLIKSKEMKKNIYDTKITLIPTFKGIPVLLPLAKNLAVELMLSNCGVGEDS